MTTTHDPQPVTSNRPTGRSRREEPWRFRWTSEQYYRLSELGFFRNRHVELIDGEIVEMAAFNPPHAIAIELATVALPRVFGPGYRVRIQLPLDLGRRNQPEPDASVLAGSARDSPSHPMTALLVIEISDTSLRYDRRVKAHLYAQANVADYWILNLVDRQLEVYRNPRPDLERAGRYHYADVTVVPESGHVSPLAAPGALVAVADFLP